MKIRIIGLGGSDKHTGIYGRDGEIAPGTEVTIKGEPPAAWKGKYEVISNDPAEGAQPVTNEKPALSGKNKAELLAIAKYEGVADVTEDMTNDDIKSAIELHREADKA